MSTREKSVFVPGLLELMGNVWKDFCNGDGALTSSAASEPPPQLTGLHPPRVSLALLRGAQPINEKVNVNR